MANLKIHPSIPASAGPRQSDGVGLLDVLTQPARRAWSALLVLTLLCGVLFFYGLGIGELYRTESLRAIIGAGFLQSGDWIVPRLYDEPLLTKPPGAYAAIAAASWWQGRVTEFTARLPAALAATFTVLLFYWYAGRQLGRLGGLITAAITPCTFLWLDKAAAAEIDMLQVAWVAAALLFFFRAVECHESFPPGEGGKAQGGVAIVWWLLALVCVAGGVLTKWTAPVFFYGAAIPFLLWRRQVRLLWSWHHVASSFLGASLCVAWVLAVTHQVGWETFRNTVMTEALPRISHQHHLGDAGKQAAEIAQHPFRLLLVNLPWSLFALFTLAPGFAASLDERGRRLLQAFHCWTWPNVLLWTLLPDHATRHSFPLFPGITGLAAVAWFGALTGRFRPAWARWFGVSAAASMVVFGLGALGGVGLGIARLPGQAWWLVLLLAGMALWTVYVALMALREARLGTVLTTIVVTWVLLKLAFVHLYVPIRNHGRDPVGKAALLRAYVPEGETLHVFRLKDEGIMFYYGRPVRRLQDWRELPLGADSTYCTLYQWEYEEVLKTSQGWRATLVIPLRDEQGDPIVLVGVTKAAPETSHAGRSVDMPFLLLDS